MKSYDGKHFQTVDRTRALQKYEELWKHFQTVDRTRALQKCMKSYDGKHFQTVDRTRALQKYVWRVMMGNTFRP